MKQSSKLSMSASISNAVYDVPIPGSSNDDAIIQENNKIGKVYPGDLVVYKSKHPWDWTPTYGTVVVPRPVKTPNLPQNVAPSNAPNTLKSTNEDAIINIENPVPSVRTPSKNSVSKEKNSSEETAPAVQLATKSNFSVHWDTSNRVRQMKRDEVCIIDRMLVRGTRVRNQEGMTGTVVNYNVKATLQIVGTNHVIQNVPLSDLSPISTFVRGQEVLYKNWVGIITNVKRKVWFRLDGGLTFFVETLESDGFMKTDPYWGLGVACPGVRTPFSPAVLKNAKWTSKYMQFFWKWFPPISFIYSFSSATVTKVEASSVNIKWLAPASTAKFSDVPPPTTIDSKMNELQLLSMPNSEYAGLNSVRMYALKPEDQANIGNNSIPVKVILRHNYVDVQWDNEKRERLPSVEVAEICEPKCHDTHRCGMVVQSDISPQDSKRYGIIQHSEDLVEAGSCTVRVHWFCEGTQKNRVVQDEGITEESIYNIHPHPKYSLFQRNTILFSTDSELHEFTAGVVLDVDVVHGNMIIFCTDNKYRKVWPHMVVPFSKRCTWNFFTRKWITDDIIPPPQQLGTDLYPKNQKLSTKEVEEVLAGLKSQTNSRGLWEDPQFDIIERAPESHWYFKPPVHLVDHNLIRIVREEFDIIRGNVPEGVYIRVYENRMDLISVLIIGPPKTPYEDSLLIFDLKLPAQFPSIPPQVHYISYTGEVHPLISEDGNFCQANLHWCYRSEEKDVHQRKSYILECVRSIQGLFFTREPYFEDGNQNPETATAGEQEKSRAYNEMVFLQVLDLYYQTTLKPHEPWKQLVAELVKRTISKKVQTLDNWIASSSNNYTQVSTSHSEESAEGNQPFFPLVPVSKGFKMTMEHRLKNLRTIFASCVPEPVESAPAVQEMSKVAKLTSSSNTLITTIEGILHQQVRGTTKQNAIVLETEEEKDVEDKEDSGFTLADF